MAKSVREAFGGVRQSFSELVEALRGITAFSPGIQPGPMLGSEAVDEARKALGGNLEFPPVTRLRWYPPDVERAQRMADNGDMMMVGQLSQSMELDGVIRGLGDARASVCDFPKRFYGSREVIDVLRTKNASDRDVYTELIPPAEKKLVVKDGLKCGIAVGEMCPVKGRNFPVLVRRYPQNLFFLPSKNQWYYRSFAGTIPINPGIPEDPSSQNWWVLFTPGGRLSPWNNGLWNTLGRSYINKTQTIFARQAYEFRHAQPARSAEAPVGATEFERVSLLRQLIRWAQNAAFVLPVGYQLKLIESNGQGIRVYGESIKTYNEEIATAYAGSAAMLQGTVGFGNMTPFQMVAKNLMTTTASEWDHLENTQILPALIASRWGIDALQNATTVETILEEPVDRNAEATAATQLANAIAGLVKAIAEAQIAAGASEELIAIDVKEWLERFGIPTLLVSKIVTPQAANDSAASGEEGGDQGGEAA